MGGAAGIFVSNWLLMAKHVVFRHLAIAVHRNGPCMQREHIDAVECVRVVVPQLAKGIGMAIAVDAISALCTPVGEFALRTHQPCCWVCGCVVFTGWIELADDYGDNRIDSQSTTGSSTNPIAVHK